MYENHRLQDSSRYTTHFDLRNIWSYMSQSVRTILRRMSFDKHKAMQQLKRLIETE